MATQTNSSKASAKPKTAAKHTTTPAVDLPVGAVLSVTERVGDLVEPFSGRKAAEKQIKSYRTQLRRQVKRTEQRGASARRQATDTIKRNREEFEQRVRKARELLPV